MADFRTDENDRLVPVFPLADALHNASWQALQGIGRHTPDVARALLEMRTPGPGPHRHGPLDTRTRLALRHGIGQHDRDQGCRCGRCQAWGDTGRHGSAGQ